MLDSWVSYGEYEGCTHYLCNAHDLWELCFIIGRDQQPWAFQMLSLLGTIKQVLDAAKASGQIVLAPEWILAFEQRDQAVIDQSVVPST